MCVAIIVPGKGQIQNNKEIEIPSLETLKYCEEANPAGGGLAWTEKDGKVHWKKGIKADEIHQTLSSGKIQPPFFIHFRIPTIGGAVKELCHPFPINELATLELEGKCESVLMHNGHWSGWRDSLLAMLPIKLPKKMGPWSDTRAMAFLSYYYDPEILDIVDEKTAVLYGNRSWKVFGSGWQEKGGCYFSNLGWERKAIKQTPMVYERERVWQHQPNRSPSQNENKTSTSKEPRAFISSIVSEADRVAISEWAKWHNLDLKTVKIFAPIGDLPPKEMYLSDSKTYLDKDFDEANKASAGCVTSRSDLMIINGGKDV